MGKRKGPQVSVEQFVKVYADSSSLDEVAEKLGWKKPSVQSRASKLRKLGVGLKRFGKAPEKVDVESLNKLLKEKGAYESPTTPKTTRGKKSG